MSMMPRERRKNVFYLFLGNKEVQLLFISLLASKISTNFWFRLTSFITKQSFWEKIENFSLLFWNRVRRFQNYNSTQTTNRLFLVKQTAEMEKSAQLFLSLSPFLSLSLSCTHSHLKHKNGLGSKECACELGWKSDCVRARVCACACDCERKRDRGVHTTIQLPPTSPPFSVESSVILDGKGKEKVEVYNDAAERKGGGGT